MVRPELKQARRIERKQYVPDASSTPDRDAAADWIETHIVNGDREWAATTISDIAIATDYSREHIATTLDAYFDPVGADTGPAAELLADIPTPEGTDEFRDGFAYGWREGVRWALRHGEDVQTMLAENETEPRR